MLLEEKVQEELEFVREAIKERRFAVAHQLLGRAVNLSYEGGIAIAPDFYRLKRELSRIIDGIGNVKEFFHELAANMVGTDSGGLVRTLAIGLNEFQNGKVDKNFGTVFLVNFVKLGKSMHEEELRKYELELDTQLCGYDGSNGFHSVFYEAPFNFCLTYDAQLIAHIGFNPWPRKLFIQQIQGIMGAAKQLGDVKWPLALVSHALEFARHHKIPSVGVVSVDNIDYARETYDVIREANLYPDQVKTFDDAKKMSLLEEQRIREAAFKLDYFRGLMPAHGFFLYDITARRLGFQRAPDGNYVKVTAT